MAARQGLATATASTTRGDHTANLTALLLMRSAKKSDRIAIDGVNRNRQESTYYEWSLLSNQMGYFSIQVFTNHILDCRNEIINDELHEYSRTGYSSTIQVSLQAIGLFRWLLWG